MDIYLLGKLHGDLPTQLLEQGEPGNRVRAMARLDGPSHDVYIALEAPDESAADALITSLTTKYELVVISKLLRCIDAPCIKAVSRFSRNGPSYIPPDIFILIELYEAKEAADALDAAATSLGGPERVAASTDGNGRLLVEMTSADEGLLHTTAEALRSSLGGASSGAHRVNGTIHLSSAGSSSG